MHYFSNLSKLIWEIVHLVGFYYRNISWCTVLWMSNCKVTVIIMGNKKYTEEVGVDVTPTQIGIPEMFAVRML